MLLWVFLLNIAITIAVGIVANEKDRNVVGWVIFSLFFGVIALIAISLVGPAYAKHYDPDRAEEEARKQYRDRRW